MAFAAYDHLGSLFGQHELRDLRLELECRIKGQAAK